MATSTSSGSSTQQSFSEPTYLETPENLLINQLSAVAAGLAQQMNAWAQGVYAQTSQITDQAVNNFFNVSQRMTNFAGGLTDQYNNLFAPQNAQLVAEANSYASPARLAANMGMAGATQAVAGENALRNSERDLLSYGIDPSSGRYAALDKAAEVQNAANIAGAENMQRVADVATGQRLRSEAVQVGAQLPAAISNAQNTAIQANTGASNATLANANTGANLNRLPNEYLRTAMGIKLPLSGQRSQSQGRSQQSSQSSSPDSSGSRSGGGSSGAGAGGVVPYYGGGGGPAWQSMSGRGVNAGGGGGGRMYNPSAAIRQIGPMQPNSGVYDYGGYDRGFENSDFDYLNQYNDPGYFSGTGWGSVGEQMYDPIDYVGSNPFSDYGFGQEYDYGGPYQTYGGNDYSDFGDVSGWGNQSNISYDPQANAYDPGWDNYYDTPSQWSDTPQNTWNDYGGGSSYFGNSWGGGGSGNYDYGNYSYDAGSGSNYFSGNDGSNYSWSDGDVYAKGGEVKPQAPMPRMPQGAMVPRAASPSGGQRVDDVRANLNAGEFVIPEDVARWKGAEFFHNLIDKSRKTRTMSPVGGKPMPAGDPRAKGPPTFSTQR